MEDIAQHRLVEAQKVEETIRKKLKDEMSALELFINETEALQAKGIGITELIRYEERITAQKQNILAIKKNLSEKSELVEKEHQHLIQRSKERQIMERLKETQNIAWKKYVDKKEAAMLDEIATTRHDIGTF